MPTLIEIMFAVVLFGGAACGVVLIVSGFRVRRRAREDYYAALARHAESRRALIAKRSREERAQAYADDIAQRRREVRYALGELRARDGRDACMDVIQRATGARGLSEVPDHRLGRLLDALKVAIIAAKLKSLRPAAFDNINGKRPAPMPSRRRYPSHHTPGPAATQSDGGSAFLTVQALGHIMTPDEARAQYKAPGEPLKPGGGSYGGGGASGAWDDTPDRTGAVAIPSALAQAGAVMSHAAPAYVPPDLEEIQRPADPYETARVESARDVSAEVSASADASPSYSSDSGSSSSYDSGSSGGGDSGGGGGGGE